MTKNTLDFDLNSLALEYEAELHLEHPGTRAPLYAPVAKGEDEESKPVKLKLHGPASDKYRKAIEQMNKKTAKRGQRPATIEESRADAAEFLTAVAIQLTNIKFDGEEISSSDGFRKLFGNPQYSWINKQAMDFLFEDGNFLK